MTALIAIVLYTASWIGLMTSTLKRQKAHIACYAGIGLGTLCHAYAAYTHMITSDGVQFGFFQVGSVIFVCINLITLLGTFRHPLGNIFILLLPLELVAILCAMLITTHTPVEQGMSKALIAHILLSIVAYSLISIATLQAILLNYQTEKLRSHHIKPLMGIFPPLQTMESLLFYLVWASFIILSLSIATGILFIEDLFAQHLTHKTAFSIISWVLYAILLFGRHALGWRGKVAIRWVIAGFAMLMLAYFGSKFVLEFILQT